jgi:peptidyl-tRNA hydrolase, PTH1 family
VIKLYAFLGNYGGEYSGNRHNVAWQFLESLPFYGALRWERKFKGRYAARETEGGRVWYLLPETYMNLSGDSAAELMRFYHVEPGELLAVHDELEMAFGSFGLKLGGGLGGHNGLRSLEARLGTRDFARMRFGIGRPDHDDIAAYVLSDFSSGEREGLNCSVFPAAAKVLEAVGAEGFEKALPKYQKVKAI